MNTSIVSVTVLPEEYFFQMEMFTHFLAPLAVGQRAYVMARCASMRPCFHALTFSLNIFLSETTYQILILKWKNRKHCGKRRKY